MSARRYPQLPFAVPPDATEVVLIRHGASQAVGDDTRVDLVDGHADPALAPEGRAQAEAVGERLAGEPFAGLYVTPLQRTRQTMAPLAARLGLEPEVVGDLREVHLGDWDGGEYRVRIANRDPVALRVFREERWDVIPGAEDMDAFAARVRAGLAAIVAATGPGRMAGAVLHGGVIGELCHQATGSRRFAFVHVDNGSVSRLVVRRDGRQLLRSFNDTAHLAAI